MRLFLRIGSARRAFSHPHARSFRSPVVRERRPLKNPEVRASGQRGLKREHPKLGVLVFSVHPEDPYAICVLEASRWVSDQRMLP